MGFTDVVSDEFAAGSGKKDAADNFPKTDYIEPPSMLQTTPENQEAKATNIRPKDEDAYSEFPFPPRKTLSLDFVKIATWPYYMLNHKVLRKLLEQNHGETQWIKNWK